jgi:hypothetical protein
MTIARTGQARGHPRGAGGPSVRGPLGGGAPGICRVLERSKAGGFLQQFRKGHVVAGIVLAKRHDPANYIEGNLTLTASFSAELKQEDRQALLQVMFGLSTSATQQALRAGAGDWFTSCPHARQSRVRSKVP